MFKLSRDIVSKLNKDGYDDKTIGDIVGVDGSYIKSIKEGCQAFRLHDLIKLEEKLKEPLPIILLKSVDTNRLSPEMKKLYDKAKKTFLSIVLLIVFVGGCSNNTSTEYKFGMGEKVNVLTKGEEGVVVGRYMNYERTPFSQKTQIVYEVFIDKLGVSVTIENENDMTSK